jgi:hypothetical protein
LVESPPGLVDNRLACPAPGVILCPSALGSLINRTLVGANCWQLSHTSIRDHKMLSNCQHCCMHPSTSYYDYADVWCLVLRAGGPRCCEVTITKRADRILLDEGKLDNKHIILINALESSLNTYEIHIRSRNRVEHAKSCVYYDYQIPYNATPNQARYICSFQQDSFRPQFCYLRNSVHSTLGS